MEPGTVVFDPIGVVTAGDVDDKGHITIQTLNFLPTCNYCKKIKKNLDICCSKCNLAKYCSSECERGDWNHHRELCTLVRDANSRHELEAMLGNSCHDC